MSRRDGREVIFKTLFELDLNSELDFDAAFEAAKGEQENFTEKDNKFALTILQGLREHLPDIDKIISSASPAWKLERMAAVDRAILRLAVYEMKFAEEKLTSNIIINEAVEIAKKYGADDSSRFVNGVLGGILKLS